MRKTFAATLACTAAALALTGCTVADTRSVTAASAPASGHRVAQRQPNVIVILADDLGWPDVSAYGSREARTPNIDRLAQSGVAFRSGYVAASVCAVSRAGLLTGRQPASFGFTYNINEEADAGAGLPASEPTLAERLKPLGYRTAAIGKWHLGAEPQFYPVKRGFDQFFGFLSGETVYVDPKTPGIVTTPTKSDKGPLDARKAIGTVVQGPDATPVDDFDKYLTTEITDHAVDFIEHSGQQPFFAYVAYNAPHWPLQVPQAYYDKFSAIKAPVRRTYLAMIAAMDDGIGRIIDTLERKGLRDDTIIVFLSDNGCPVQFGFCAPEQPFGAGKFTYLEGGVRVPFILSWPGRVKPGGMNDSPVSSLDIVPTVLRAAAPRQALPKGLDGEDLVATIEHPPVKPRLLMWGQEPVFAARQGPLKLWKSYNWKQTKLFNVESDPWEKTDLSSAQTADRAALEQQVESWRATLPKPLWRLHATRKVTIDGRETEWVY
ncbi:sulfatase-like hydrolase/transferase [Sphingobium sp. CAP-1]|uniref:sulfatase-like hydrolase/transferase n=1 Tax=Sphingobium sp. CAP-1 TaxID=2676077 RepID=UPI001E59204C|nr:sulfatase-like hydrolase/transferase [Sphingobium sp. CAP-1]